MTTLFIKKRETKSPEYTTPFKHKSGGFCNTTVFALPTLWNSNKSDNKGNYLIENRKSPQKVQRRDSNLSKRKKKVKSRIKEFREFFHFPKKKMADTIGGHIRREGEFFLPAGSASRLITFYACSAVFTSF
jgi:hypothetical protein